MKRIGIALLLTLAAACGDATSPTESFQGAGVIPDHNVVESEAVVEFANDDGRPHQVGSTDCPELASGDIAPGASFTVHLGVGPKTCTFHDPTDEQFSGILEVLAPQPVPPPPEPPNGG